MPMTADQRRLQAVVPDWVQSDLKRIADRERVSMSELLREFVMAALCDGLDYRGAWNKGREYRQAHRRMLEEAAATAAKVSNKRRRK